jgi:hypothetical protein
VRIASGHDIAACAVFGQHWKSAVLYIPITNMLNMQNSETAPTRYADNADARNGYSANKRWVSCEVELWF